MLFLVYIQGKEMSHFCNAVIQSRADESQQHMIKHDQTCDRTKVTRMIFASTDETVLEYL